MDKGSKIVIFDETNSLKNKQCHGYMYMLSSLKEEELVQSIDSSFMGNLLCTLWGKSFKQQCSKRKKNWQHNMIICILGSWLNDAVAVPSNAS